MEDEDIISKLENDSMKPLDLAPDDFWIITAWVGNKAVRISVFTCYQSGVILYIGSGFIPLYFFIFGEVFGSPGIQLLALVESSPVRDASLPQLSDLIGYYLPKLISASKINNILFVLE